MSILYVAKNVEIKCPSCDSDALYRYGKAWTGKQRYLCLICGRQFTTGNGRTEGMNNPRCPACGKLMHIYRRENSTIRFRCSGYPSCKTFKKIRTKEEGI